MTVRIHSVNVNKNPYAGYRTLNVGTPQSEPIVGETMILNNAGGYAYELDEWKALERFLILGTEGGTFYVGQQKLTADNAKSVRKLIAQDGIRVVNTVLSVSEGNRAPKVDPSLFTLALAISFGNDATKRAVIAALPRVARIGTHIFSFVEYATAHRGWGRVLRDAVANWYTTKTPERLAYQVVKYQQRNGWSHRDLLRLSHAKATGELNDVLKYAVKGTLPQVRPTMDDPLGQFPNPQILFGVEQAKKATSVKEIVWLIEFFDLPRECIPTVWLKEKAVWEALLKKMPLTAMIRNLATMSRVGLLTPMSEAGRKVVDQLNNVEALRKARVHPIQLLSAYKVYSSGSGYLSRGDSFTPLPQITQALQDAFYSSFGLVEPSGKRTLLGLDTSGSMSGGTIAGVPGLTPREAAACMAMITVRSEWSDGAVKYPLYHAVNFTTTVKEFPIAPTDSLKQVIDLMSRQPHGATDCASPIKYALDRGIPVDTFITYTDGETWAGRDGHPSEVLKLYRKKTGIDARNIIVAFTSTGFTLSDPKDNKSLDIAGFDTSTPSVISSFSRGDI